MNIRTKLNPVIISKFKAFKLQEKFTDEVFSSPPYWFSERGSWAKNVPQSYLVWLTEPSNNDFMMWKI